MKIIRYINKNEKKISGATVAIGNFDGIHLGHLKVINLVKNIARGNPSGVLTFEPHPRTYFNRELEPFRLMDSSTRIARLRELKLDLVIELCFDKILENLTPHKFAKEILSEKLSLKNVVIGCDFQFGKGRAGNVDDLIKYGKEFGFKVSTVNIKKSKSQEISSSIIRKLLKAGKPEKAAEMLGRNYQISGKVEKGFQLGRTLGFPTINLKFKDTIVPRYGVYAARVNIITGKNRGQYNGVASIGERPTFGKHLANLEVYIFDFSGNLYDQEVTVSLIEYQRDEIAYEDKSDLIMQMNKDCNLSRKILSQESKSLNETKNP